MHIFMILIEITVKEITVVQAQTGPHEQQIPKVVPARLNSFFPPDTQILIFLSYFRLVCIRFCNCKHVLTAFNVTVIS